MNQKAILADLHTHLNEKKIDPKEWWAAAKQKKLSVIAITEHSYYEPRDAYLKLKAIQPKGILLIPGVEAKTSAGDLLIYGEDESIYDTEDIFVKGINVEKALTAVKKHGLVASFAHPHGFKLDSICEALGEKEATKLVKKYKTGAEYYNGMLGSANQLLFGRKIVKKFYGLLDFMDHNRATSGLKINKPTHWTKGKMEKIALETIERVRQGMLFSEKAEFITVGSDAHYPRSIGSSVIELKKMPKNEKEFLTMLKNKEILWAGPNIHLQNPVDRVGRKEIFEGLVYLTKKKILKKPKIRIVKKIKQKILQRKGIKRSKKISKKAKGQ
jgi:hypothetical protein